jgi:hypothetical protein
MDRDLEPPQPRAEASGAYALDRLLRAVETATGHADPAVRERAAQKAEAWDAVLRGMAGGTLHVGSRTPVADTPAWVTLEVAHGGFPTGRYLAESTLDEAEQATLAGLPAAAVGMTDRMRLNVRCLTDDGLAELERALRDGTYTVELPEHGALLVVAWLVAHGHEALALDLVAELHPLIDRLRFTPMLTAERPADGDVVRLRDVGQVVRELERVRTPAQVAAMNESLTVWNPLYDRLVALWLDTVDGVWPCARWPADWADRRSRWLADYEAAAAAHPLCRDHRRPRSNFSILRVALAACPEDSAGLTGRDVGRIRMVLERSVARWGTPGGAGLAALRARQAAWAARPTRQLVAAAVAERLAPLRQDRGLPDPAAVLRPVPVAVAGGEQALPPSVVRRVERAREGTVGELASAGIVGSGEVLAEVLPQVTSHVLSAAYGDTQLRHLYARIYEAFRRRRSLLLLHLQRQVQVEELPWVSALDGFRTTTAVTRARARDTLREVALLALTSWPHAIVPNQLVREMAALGAQADLDLPLVEELAADIFMGAFTTKWTAAAALTSEALAGTLYARYYDLPDAATWDEGTPPAGLLGRLRRRRDVPPAQRFARMCADRAREAEHGDGSFVARNGTVIEQSQILTSHDLAPLVDRLDLREEVAGRAADLAARAFRWIVHEQTVPRRAWGDQRRTVKNTAYAWRQALFFLSFAPGDEQAAAVAGLRELGSSRPAEWQRRFEPVVAGLEAVVAGDRFDASGRTGTGRRFLGWSVGRHWLLPAAGR